MEPLQTVRMLQQRKDDIRQCREQYFWAHFKFYGWSVAGNIMSAIATLTANTSPRLFTLLYILKYFIFVSRPTSKEGEMERQINIIFDDAIRHVKTVRKNNPVTSFCNNLSLKFSVPFASFLWDLTKRFYRDKPPKRKFDDLGRAFIIINGTVERQKCEIEKLTPMLKKIQSLSQSNVCKVVSNACKVVKAIPGVEMPEKLSTKEALLKQHIQIQNKPVSNNPRENKRTEIDKATRIKNKFHNSSLNVLESARKCLQAKEEAKVLPTLKLAQNLKLLEEANKNLDAIKEIKLEFQLLNHEKQKSQQAIVEGISTMLDNTTEALENVSDFIDIRSELEKSRIQKSAKRVQEYAKQGYEINHQVEEAIKAMTEANKAMVNIYNSTKGWFSDGMQINELRIPVGTENDWITQSKDLADSVKLLGEHAEKLTDPPEDIMKELFTTYRTESMTQNATDMANEALSIADQIEWEISNYNPDSQILVLEQVFQSIWSASTETAKMQRDTAVSKMRTKAQKLRWKVADHKSFSSKLLAVFYQVDTMSLLIAIFGTVVDVISIFKLFKMHPKEILIRNEIERILQILNNHHEDDQVPEEMLIQDEIPIPNNHHEDDQVPEEILIQDEIPIPNNHHEDDDPGEI
ncbi:uncharacterized protein LOC132714532 [Ruditapes philippinarum]|uniref:uncharacterized protein LOC132714532 n=1 Tax=Ruditapes philippinarum TaxID=129788 RepID=UPI00295B3E1C|nr:uncharacterized protein LOC132714532 [Ruditapes philippinarum]